MCGMVHGEWCRVYGVGCRVYSECWCLNGGGLAKTHMYGLEQDCVQRSLTYTFLRAPLGALTILAPGSG
jgi:hypothetical protein